MECTTFNGGDFILKVGEQGSSSRAERTKKFPTSILLKVHPCGPPLPAWGHFASVCPFYTCIGHSLPYGVLSVPWGPRHRRSQNFFWGCTFSSKKLTTFYGRRPQNYKATLLTTPMLPISPPMKKCPKNLTLALPVGALNNFPCILRPHFFSALGVLVHPVLCTPFPTSMPLSWGVRGRSAPTLHFWYL